MASSSSNWSSGNTAIVPGMMGVYNQLLGLNTQNYGNILKGYGQAQNFASARQGQIDAGYGRLQNQVVRTLGLGGGGWGVAAPAARDIQDTLARTLGETDQQMINSGLGNTTVRANARTQTAGQAGRAIADLGAKLASTAAGYISNIGLAAQQGRMQGLGMQNQLAAGYLNNLAGFRFANTAGDLTGHFQSGGGASNSFDSPGGGGGGGGRRGGGGGSDLDSIFGGFGGPAPDRLVEQRGGTWTQGYPTAYGQMGGGPVYPEQEAAASGSQDWETGDWASWEPEE